MSTLPQILADLRLPVIGSPMFIVSSPELVAAQCKAGIVGSFPALNARPESELDAALTRIEDEIGQHNAEHPEAPAAPYAVNLIVNPRTNLRLEHDLAVVVEHRVPIVITSLGALPHVNEAVHSYGGIVLHDVIHDRFARKAIEKGADGVIAVAAGAGGHAGRQSPFALVQEIRRWFDGPLVVGGAIANGRSIAAVRTLGADLAYIGTPFIATKEAAAADAYKDMLVASTAEDVIYTDVFTGMHANFLIPSIEAIGLKADELSSIDRSGINPGTKPKAWSEVWGSGQGIGALDQIVSVNELVNRYQHEYTRALSTVWTDPVS